MVQKGKIGHEGIVKSISGQTVEVMIVSHSACSACHAKSMCGASEMMCKVIQAEYPGFKITVGDKVIVYASLKNAVLSVVLAYIIPSVVLVGAIPFLLALGYSETIAAVGSLISVAVYFFILYLTRKATGKKIKFTLEKPEE